MTQELSRINVQEPLYYHREYENDLQRKQGENYWLNLAKRAAITSAPYVSLYKPAGLALTLAMGATRSVASIINLASALQQQDSKDIPYQLLQTTIAVVSFAGTIIAHPVGMLITTGQDLIFDLNNLIGHLNSGRHEEALVCCVQILNNSLYLALFLRGGLELGVASLVVQIGLGLYHSMDELKKGNYIECAGHMGMALIRGNQVKGQMQVIRIIWQDRVLEKSPQPASVKIKTNLKKTMLSIKGQVIESTGKKPEEKEIAEILIKYNESKSEVIFKAASAGDLVSVKKLRDYDVMPQADDKKTQILECACRSGKLDLLKYLVEDVKIKPSKIAFIHLIQQKTPFFECIDYFINRGFVLPEDIIYYSFFNFHSDAGMPAVDTVKFLINRGASTAWFKKPEFFNETNNMLSCAFSKSKMDNILVVSDGNKNEGGVQHGIKKDLSLFDLLVSHGLEINRKIPFVKSDLLHPNYPASEAYAFYDTPLLAAISNGDEILVKRLIELGANVNFCGREAIFFPNQWSIPKISNHPTNISPLKLGLTKGLSMTTLLLNHGSQLDGV